MEGLEGVEDGLVFGGVVGGVSEVVAAGKYLGVPYSSDEGRGGGSGISAGGTVGVDGDGGSCFWGVDLAFGGVHVKSVTAAGKNC